MIRSDTKTKTNKIRRKKAADEATSQTATLSKPKVKKSLKSRKQLN